MTNNRIKDFLDVLLKGKNWEDARGRLAFEQGMEIWWEYRLEL